MTTKPWECQKDDTQLLPLQYLHELDTWNVKQMQTKNGMKPPHEAQGPMKWSQLHVTHTMHDTSRKHIWFANYNILV